MIIPNVATYFANQVYQEMGAVESVSARKIVELGLDVLHGFK